MSTARATIADLKQMKAEGRKIVMLTAYDAPLAHFVEAGGVPAILVGDSVGNTVLGYENTLPVTVDDILRHTQAVVRGTRRALIIADMPFLSYQVSNERALLNAGRLIQEGGAQAVKLEGGKQTIAVTAHLGGYRHSGDGSPGAYAAVGPPIGRLPRPGTHTSGSGGTSE